MLCKMLKLSKLVQLLGQVPRIILLILKTNDLSITSFLLLREGLRLISFLIARSLDENLHTSLGPVRNFMILARYCSRTVFWEQLENISQHGSILWPTNLFRFVRALYSYLRIDVQLSLYEYFLSCRRAIGLAPSISLR